MIHLFSINNAGLCESKGLKRTLRVCITPLLIFFERTLHLAFMHDMSDIVVDFIRLTSVILNLQINNSVCDGSEISSRKRNVFSPVRHALHYTQPAHLRIYAIVSNYKWDIVASGPCFRYAPSTKII